MLNVNSGAPGWVASLFRLFVRKILRTFLSARRYTAPTTTICYRKSVAGSSHPKQYEIKNRHTGDI